MAIILLAFIMDNVRPTTDTASRELQVEKLPRLEKYSNRQDFLNEITIIRLLMEESWRLSKETKADIKLQKVNKEILAETVNKILIDSERHVRPPEGIQPQRKRTRNGGRTTMTLSEKYSSMREMRNRGGLSLLLKEGYFKRETIY